MKITLFNKYLVIVFSILLFVLNISLLKKVNSFTEQEKILKDRIAFLNKEMLKLKPSVTERTYENFLEGKKIPFSILNNSVYKNYFFQNPKTNKLLIILVGTSVDCSSCTKEEIEMWKEFFNSSNPNDISAFSIYHNNNDKSLQKFINNYQNIFPVISDPEFLFKRELSIQRTPIILVINKNRITYVHIPLNNDKDKTKNFIKKIERTLH